MWRWLKILRRHTKHRISSFMLLSNIRYLKNMANKNERKIIICLVNFLILKLKLISLKIIIIIKIIINIGQSWQTTPTHPHTRTHPPPPPVAPPTVAPLKQGAHEVYIPRRRNIYEDANAAQERLFLTCCNAWWVSDVFPHKDIWTT